jgi:hypothetical protein
MTEQQEKNAVGGSQDSAFPMKKIKVDGLHKHNPELTPDEFEGAFYSNSRKHSKDYDSGNKPTGGMVAHRHTTDHGEGIGMPVSSNPIRIMVPNVIFDQEKDYKKESNRIYLANLTIFDKIAQLKAENEALKKKILAVKSEKSSRMKAEEARDDESNSGNESGSGSYSIGKRRKKRRRKEEIERAFKCGFKECTKSYG